MKIGAKKFATLALAGMAVVFVLMPAAAEAGTCCVCVTDLGAIEGIEQKITDYLSTNDPAKCADSMTENKTCQIEENDKCPIFFGVTKLDEDLQIKDINNILGISIPGLRFSAPQKEVDAEGNLAIPWIGEYLKAVYNFSLVALSILGVIVIILQGARVIASAGGAEQGDAYKKIFQVIVGLVIGWGSYLILFSINPALTTLKPLKVQYIVPIDIGQIVNAGTDNGEAADQVVADEKPPAAAVADTCVPSDQIVKLAGSGVKTGGAASTADAWLQTEALEALKAADRIAKSKGKDILVISAGRTWSQQERLWQNALKQNGNDEKIARQKVAKPSCKAPHMTGRAVDLCLENSSSCGKVAKTKALINPNEEPDVKLLQDIMKQAGWKRFCKEWWHFEYNLSVSGGRSPNSCPL